MGYLLGGSIVNIFEGEETEVGEGAIDADIETEVGRLGVVVIEFPMTMTVEHDGAEGFWFHVTIG